MPRVRNTPIHKFLEQRGLTEVELIKRVCCSARTVQRWLREATRPHQAICRSLARILQTDEVTIRRLTVKQRVHLDTVSINSRLFAASCCCVKIARMNDDQLRDVNVVIDHIDALIAALPPLRERVARLRQKTKVRVMRPPARPGVVVGLVSQPPVLP
ncbi:MAG TPA: helix-turn-helix transcriptional regulator [Pirellulaceae bacterium]|nr:helix-turn-helix transcriptional regulator [Pirellulaceae bacterium]